LALERAVEPAEPHHRIVELRVREALRLAAQLLRAERVQLEPLGSFFRLDARSSQALERAQVAEMAAERAGEPRRDVATSS
jgi:hypothetical protein